MLEMSGGYEHVVDVRQGMAGWLAFGGTGRALEAFAVHIDGVARDTILACTSNVT